MSLGAAAAPAPVVKAATTPPRGRLDALGIVVVAALTNGLLLAPLPPEVRLPGALVLFIALPGHVFVQTIFNGPRPGALERCVLALGCGYALATLLGLALYALFRPLDTPHILAGADALIAVLLLGALARRAELRPPLGRPHWPPLLVLAVAAPLRLYNLDYSEFQGDEAKVVLRTAAVLQGIPDALIAHRKPPGEILLNAPFAGGLGVITELEGRLPFSLAGVAGVVAFYCLGRAMFGPRVGLAAGLLLAVNGFFVAFARILQYQSVGLLLDTLAVLCLFRFARGSTARRGYAAVGALLMAAAGLMALSGIFLLPVAAVALWRCVFGLKRVPWRDLAVWLWPLALLIPSIFLVYVVLLRGASGVLEPSSAWFYLGPRVGGTRPYFNLEAFLLSANHYLSSPYLAAVLGAGLLALIKPLFERVRDLLERPTAAGRRAAFAWPMVNVDSLGPAALFAGLVGLLLSFARRSLAWKLALVWMAGPLFAHLFLIRIPGTHWREAFPGLLLLVATGTAGLYVRLAAHRARLAALLAGGLLLAGAGHYVYVAWIQPWPEYQLLYPRYRHPLDWTSLEVRSAGGTFGATRRHGWKAVGDLVARGQLPADYVTNERQAQAAWYLKRTQVCPEEAGLIVRAPVSPRDRQAVESGEVPAGYFLAGQVYAAGRLSLSILTREPPPSRPQVYRAEDYGWRFDQELASPWAPLGRIYRPSIDVLPRCLQKP